MVRVKATPQHRDVIALQRKIERERTIRHMAHLISTDVFKLSLSARYTFDELRGDGDGVFKKASDLLQKALIESVESERMNATPKRETKPWKTVLSLNDDNTSEKATQSAAKKEFIWETYVLFGVRFDLISNETVNEILAIGE